MFGHAGQVSGLHIVVPVPPLVMPPVFEEIPPEFEIPPVVAVPPLAVPPVLAKVPPMFVVPPVAFPAPPCIVPSVVPSQSAPSVGVPPPANPPDPIPPEPPAPPPPFRKRLESELPHAMKHQAASTRANRLIVRIVRRQIVTGQVPMSHQVRLSATSQRKVR